MELLGLWMIELERLEMGEARDVEKIYFGDFGIKNMGREVVEE